MTDKNERIQILEMIENGVITADEGARLLQAFDDDDRLEETRNEYSASTSEAAFGDEPDPMEEVVLDPEYQPDFERWKRYWVIPLWIGVGFTIIGSLVMLWIYQSTGFSFWFACSWLPFLIGVGLITMAWGSRSARWLHLRIQQEPGEWPQTIAFSFPLPLNFAAWFMRTFGQFIPKVNEIDLDFDKVIETFKNSTTPENPFYVEVDEGENGEIVQIYIG
jgi:hypothetical protein